MKSKQFKRIISMLLMCVIAMETTIFPINAHNNDIWPGTVPYNMQTIRIGIHSSAVVPLLSTLTNFNQVRSSTNGWNGISSKVNISSVVSEVNNVDIEVYGSNFSDKPSTLGELRLIGAPGTTEPHQNWRTVFISMNINPTVWGINATSQLRSQRFTHTFIHEVGHALKLDHPRIGGNPNGSGGTIVDGHNIHRSDLNGWVPLAVMTPGFYDSHSSNSQWVSNHDRDNIKKKWGN